MAKLKSSDLGKLSIDRLLFLQGLPAGIGILVMSLNIVIDTIFVGNWIGSNAIAAINVVLPATIFLSAMGMAIGVGGGSIISRALGANNYEKAYKTFGNEIVLTITSVSILVLLGLIFNDWLVPRLGGKGQIFEPAKTYYNIILYGVPIQALAMMGSNTLRSEGKPRHAMIALIFPSITNIIGDYLLIKVFGMGMAGAALATTLSYVTSFGYILWCFTSQISELKIKVSHLRLDKSIVKEISGLGLVTFARQGVVSLVYLIVNNLLFNMGGESAVAVYGIVGRLMMFALFPVLGVTQGFVPIAGYNYGANKPRRVHESIKKAVLYACLLAIVIFGIIQLFAPNISAAFTDDTNVLSKAPNRMCWVFAATPIISLQLIGAAYFQAIGKATPALFLTLTRQGFFFIPLVLILPNYFEEMGIWYSFPIADILSTVVTAIFLNHEIKRDLIPREKQMTSPKG